MVKDDKRYLLAFDARPNYDFTLLTGDMIKILGSQQFADTLGVKSRCVRRWREGSRNPNYMLMANIFKVARENGLNIQKYKVKNAQADNRIPG